MAIAPGLIPEHCPSQERLAPKSDKALRIEIARMNCPKPHVAMKNDGVRCAAFKRA
jgi:hypothetical protein